MSFDTSGVPGKEQLKAAGENTDGVIQVKVETVKLLQVAQIDVRLHDFH